MTSEKDNQPQMKIITINIETPDGKLPTAKVRIPNIPMRLADLVPPMQQLCNGIVELANKKELASGTTISCKKGCGVCCCQLVPLSAPEAFFLYGYIKSLPEEKRKALEEKFSEIRKAMDSAGIIERLHDIENTKEHKVLAWDYFRLGMSCPFLEDDSCSIHQIRPFACREYNVTSPSELCADPFHNDIKKIPVSRNMTTATAYLAAELCATKPMLIPMTLLLDWVEENKMIGGMAWAGVWLFELMLEYATGDKLEDKEEL